MGVPVYLGTMDIPMNPATVGDLMNMGTVGIPVTGPSGYSHESGHNGVSHLQ